MSIKRRGKGDSINRKQLLEMLRCIHLNGTVEECKLTIKKGIAEVECVDITNSIIIIAEERVMSKSITADMGFGNLELLIKFLSTVGDDTLNLEVTDTKITVSNADNSHKLNYLLTEPNLISTTLLDAGENAKETINDLGEFEFPLNESIIKDLLKYSHMVDSKSDEAEVILKYIVDEQLSFIFGKANQHQFELSLDADDTKIEGEANESNEDEFEVIISEQHLTRILNNIHFDEDNPPIMRFAEGAPVIIKVNDNMFWAISSTISEEGE